MCAASTPGEKAELTRSHQMKSPPIVRVGVKLRFLSWMF